MNRAERRRANKGKEKASVAALPQSVNFLLPEPMFVGREVKARLLELHDDNPVKGEFCTVSRRLLSLLSDIGRCGLHVSDRDLDTHRGRHKRIQERNR